MFYTFYKTTNKVNGKFYYGTHKTNNLNDDYLGSGLNIQRAIDKHGRDNFSKEILFSFDNPEEMFAKEAEIVNEECLNNPHCYNISLGGHGGFGYINQQGLNNVNKNWKEISDKLSKSLTGKPNPATSERLRLEHKHGKRLKVDPQAFRGMTHTKETKIKISRANKGRIPYNKGIPRSEETKRRISEALKAKNQTQDSRIS